MKNNKNLIIIILVCLVLGLGGFIVCDKFINQNEVKDEVENNKVESNVDNNNEEDVDKDEENIDLTNEEIFMKELEEKLVTSDNTISLYYDGLSIEDVSSENFIAFNIRQYMLDNDVEHPGKCGPDITEEYASILKKDVINKYIQNKYNVSKNYSLKNDANNYIFLSGNEEFISLEDKYVVGCLARSGDYSYMASKAIRYEEENEYVYFYNKAVFCGSDVEAMLCDINPNDDNAEDNIFWCYGDCEKYGILDFKTLTNYVLNKYYDELNTYKHTFKKSGNEYYWVKTEIVK